MQKAMFYVLENGAFHSVYHRVLFSVVQVALYGAGVKVWRCNVNGGLMVASWFTSEALNCV